MAFASTSAHEFTDAGIAAFDRFHLRIPQSVIATVVATEAPPDPEQVSTRVRAAFARHLDLRRTLPAQGSRIWPLLPQDWIRAWEPPRLGGPAASGIGRHGLGRALCDFYTSPYGKATPLWRVGLVESAGGDLRHGAMFTFHHAAADGARALELMAAMIEMPQQPRMRERALSGDDDAARERAVLGPLLLRALDEMTGRRQGYLAGRSSHERQLHVGQLSRAEARRVARRAGCPVSDVLVGQVAAALGHRAHPDGRTASGRSVRLLVPRLARASVDGNNRYLPFVETVAPPAGVADFRAVACARAKAGRPTAGEARAHALRMRLLAAAPAPLLRAFYHDWAQRLDALCTILSVPVGEASIGGAAVRHLHGFAPLLWSHGASFCFLVHPETITLGVVSDPAIVADGDVLVDAVLALPPA